MVLFYPIICHCIFTLLSPGLSLLLIKGVLCRSENSVEKHLEMGKKLLAAGQLADALSHLHAAVDGDPKNYLAYYRRSTVYLATGKSKSALADLCKVLDLKSDFTSVSFTP
ncbi:hypothetical protein AMELA_G00289130 [Ameiurus melas]|uniref:Uncharacterized protein n=1 Tax=Ameiurus melas TaxID=219545 RepID=A0A7J5ZHW0_AMEME|nr:hypothetical protein AMELA_G00289130 [Ameiurus melas]